MPGRRRFLVVLIKPSHYDADGYVIQWHRSTIPSNSLASAYGLLSECAHAHALGTDVDIDIDPCGTGQWVGERLPVDAAGAAA